MTLDIAIDLVLELARKAARQETEDTNKDRGLEACDIVEDFVVNNEIGNDA